MSTSLSLTAQDAEALSLSELEAELVAADRSIGRESFRNFVQMAWHILEPAVPFVTNWHIDAMCEHAQAVSEGRLRKLIVNVPPGSTKSMIWSVFWPVWDWIREPANRFLTASYADVLSLRDALKSRRLMTSQWFQDRWGERIVLTGDQNAKSRYENSATGYRIATHVGGATGERAGRRLLDDPHNIEDMESDIVREGVIEWVRTVWSEREADPRTSVDVVVMQRLHERDVCGFLLEEIGGYDHLMLPMRFEPSRRCVTSIGFRDPRTQEDEVLWPLRWPIEIVKDKEKRLGPYGASGQLQQRPSPAEGGIFKRHWWKYWQYPGQSLPPVMVKQPDGTYQPVAPVDLPYVFDEQVQSWDMTFKDLDQNDYVVGHQYGLKGPDNYLVDEVRDHMDFTTTVSAMETFNAKHPLPSSKLIEDKANGPAVISVVRKKIPGVIAWPVKGDKMARASAYSYLPHAGNCYLPHPQLAPWVNGFIDELANFPNATHDDRVDTWSQAMDKFYRPEDQGLAITPEFSDRFHTPPKPIDPVPGLPSFRFWYEGLYPCCVIGQTLQSGRIVLFDCVLGEQNSGLEELIDNKVIPLLKADYAGCTDWRDITNHGPLSANSEASEHSMDAIILDKLDGAPEAGEPDFFLRVNAVKGLLQQTGRLIVNNQSTPGEPKPWLRDALAGGWAYRRDQHGTITKTEARKFHPLTSVGEAIGHGCARIFMRKPTPPPRSNRKKEQSRAKSYAV